MASDYTSDYELAKILQEEWNSDDVELYSSEAVFKKPSVASLNRPSQSYQTAQLGIVDPQWELIDPTPDIRVLFNQFNANYFWNQLGSVTVDWSKRMTLYVNV